MSRTQLVAQEVAFVLTDIEFAEDILDNLPPHVWPIAIDHRGDALGAMARELACFPRLSSIHLFCHGEQGLLKLGSDWLCAGNLHSHTGALDTIGTALRGGDLLLYACEVARGQQGQAFTAGLSRALGANVAASSGLVGAARLGGSWELDQMHGSPATLPLAFAGFRGVLAVNGSVSLTGMQEVGQTLTAVITDSNGFDPANVEYKWYRVNTTTSAETLVPALSGTGDAFKSVFLDSSFDGWTMKLYVTYTDNSSPTGSAEAPAAANVWYVGHQQIFMDHKSITMNEDGSSSSTGTPVTVVLDGAYLSSREYGYTSSQLKYVIRQMPAHGVLQFNGGSIDLNTTSPPATGTVFTQDDIDSGKLTYTPDANYNGTDTFKFNVFDGVWSHNDDQTFNITINKVNDTHTGDAAVTLLAVQGDTIYATRGDIADIDGFSAATPLSYQWQISDDGISGWTNVGGATSDSYLLGIPEADKYLRAVVTYTDGQGHTEISYSNSTNQVIPNTPPSLDTNGGLAATEDTEIRITAGQLAVSDVEQPKARLVYSLSTLPLHGTLSVNGVAVTATGVAFTQADIENSAPGMGVRYTPALNYHGSDGFTFTVSDGSGGSIGSTAFSINVSNVNDAPGGTLSYSGTVSEGYTLTAGNTLTDGDGITPGAISYAWQVQDGSGVWNTVGTAGTLVLDHAYAGHAVRLQASYVDDTGHAETVTTSAAAVNTAPVLTNAGLTVNEDTGIRITPSELALADPEQGAAARVFTLTALPLHGTLTLNGTPVGAVPATFTQADIENAAPGMGLRYQADSNFSGADHILFTASDGAGGIIGSTRFDINVVAVNDTPTVDTNLGLTLNEDDGATEISSSMLASSDADDAADDLVYTIEAGPSKGTLSFAAGATFTKADLAAHLLTYRPNANANLGDSFTFSVKDPHGAILEHQTFTISINALDDAYTGGTSFTGTVSEGETLTAANDLADVDGMPAPGVAYEWQVKNGLGVWDAVGSGSTLLLDPSYAHHELRLKASFTDGGGKVETSYSAVEIVNTRPTLANNGVAVTEETEVRITAGDLFLSDPEQGGAQLVYTLTALPAHGTLTLDGVAITSVPATFTQADIENAVPGMGLHYTPAANYFGPDSFTFTASDGDGGTIGSQAFNIAVSNVDDAPGGSVTFTGTVSEGETLTAHNTITDNDGIPAPGISYEWQVKDGLGVWNAAGSGTTLLIDHAHAGHEIRLKASYTDGAGKSESMLSAVDTVNTRPTVSNNGMTVAEDSTAVAITPAELAAADPEQGAALRVFTLGSLPAHGKLYLNGVEITSTAQTFTQDDIGNAAPGMGLRYTPAANYHGADSFTFTVDDGDGGTVGSQAFNITVSSVDDQPGGTLTVAGTVSEGETVTVADSLTDVEGMGPVSYEWQVKDSLGVWNVAGSGASLVLAPAYAGRELRVKASYTDGESHADSFTTAPVLVNTKPLLVANAGLSIAEDAAVRITPAELSVHDDDQGAAQRVYTVGTLPAHGTLMVNGVALAAAGQTFTQADIENAAPGMGVRYIPYANYYGADLFQFSVSDGAGGAIASTDFAITVAEVNDLPLGAVSIASHPMVNQALAASSTLTDAEGLGVFSYAWEASADGSSGWAAIPGATAASYTPLAADLGKFLRVKIAYTDGRGAAETVYSNVSDRVVPVPVPTSGDDRDGVSSEIESRVPAMGGALPGDGNGDGIRDAEQSYVTSLPWMASGDKPSSYVTLTNDLKLDQLAARTLVSPAVLPIDLKMPVGQLEASIYGVAAGKTLKMTAFVSSDIIMNGYWMQNRSGEWVDVSTSIITMGARTRIEFSITDGGEFDADGKVDGRITEIGAPGNWSTDHDQDGIPNAVEGSVGKGVDLRDNFVFERGDLFVMQVYRDAFGSEIGAGTKDMLQSKLDNHLATEAEVAKEIIDQQLEMLGNLPSLYIAMFGQPAGKAAFDSWNAGLQQGMNASQIAGQLLSSDWFGGSQRSDDGVFVSQLYENALNRTAERAGYYFWLEQLQAGKSRADIVQGVIGSQEFHALHDTANAVTALYVDLLDRAPEAAGLAYWMGLSEAGMTHVEMIGGFLNSAEYHSRFY